jgi:hypothetical protein
MRGKSGKIITFYSYKGGTGPSMAVSNVAWILASNGYDVLLIDWDLEAPGLHRYLRPFLVDPELTSSPGVIDFVWDAARVNVTPSDKSQATSLAAEFPSLEDTAAPPLSSYPVALPEIPVPVFGWHRGKWKSAKPSPWIAISRSRSGSGPSVTGATVRGAVSGTASRLFETDRRISLAEVS